MDIKVRGKYEERPLKLKDIRPMLKNLRIRSKSSREEEQDENRQNPQNYAEYKTSTSSKKVAEKSIQTVAFSAKQLKFRGKDRAWTDTSETSDSPAARAQGMTFFAKKEKKKKAQATAASKQYVLQQFTMYTFRQQRKRKRNYHIKRIKNQVRNLTIASSTVVLLAMVLFVLTLSLFFFLAEDGDGNIETGQLALMVSVAKSQIGNEGGEKYWRWYGFDEPVDWCACFVSWCANEVGLIENGAVPRFSECNEGMRWFQQESRWIENSEETSIQPTPGMIIFFDWGQDGIADHVGIVEACKNGIIYTIEGNSGDACRNMYYLEDSKMILGYGIMNIT